MNVKLIHKILFNYLQILNLSPRLRFCSSFVYTKLGGFLELDSAKRKVLVSFGRGYRSYSPQMGQI